MALPLCLLACKDDEEVSSDCYEAVVVDQGCGTVLAVVDKNSRIATLLDTRPSSGDTVLVNTLNLARYYQVPGKRIYITMAPVPESETPECPTFIPVIYPHVKILTTQETPCP